MNRPTESRRPGRKPIYEVLTRSHAELILTAALDGKRLLILPRTPWQLRVCIKSDQNIDLIARHKAAAWILSTLDRRDVPTEPDGLYGRGWAEICAYIACVAPQTFRNWSTEGRRQLRADKVPGFDK